MDRAFKDFYMVCVPGKKETQAKRENREWRKRELLEFFHSAYCKTLIDMSDEEMGRALQILEYRRKRGLSPMKKDDKKLQEMLWGEHGV